MIVYADLVFLINFFGDFLCLWLLSEAEAKIPLWRRIIVAGLGGIYGLLCTYPPLFWLEGIVCKVLCALLMVTAAYIPTKPRSLFRATAMLFMSSMLLAGGAELVGAKSLFRILLAIFGTACLAVCALSLVRSRIYAKYMPCTLCLFGKKLHMIGFYDSGNRLFLKNNERAVIVCDERVLKKLVAEEANAKNLYEWINSDRFAVVPFSGAAGGTMQGIVLDYATVGTKRYDDVVLAVSESALQDKLILHSIMV